MIQVKHIKKVTSFLLILVTALMLVACSTNDNVPYGDISDETYLSVGEDVTITEKDLYNNLRGQSSAFLSTIIEEKLFEGYKSEAKRLLAEENPEEGSLEELAQQKFDDLVNEGIFGTKDVEKIKDFRPDTIRVSIIQFADSMYQLNSKINRDDLINVLTDMVNENRDEEFAKGYYAIESDELKDVYLINLQKELYARERLVEDIEDEDSEAYLKDSNVISHYKNEVKNRHDVNVFYFHFLNHNEATEALRSVNVKISDAGHYYLVPDVRLVSTYELYKNQPESNVMKAIVASGLEGKFKAFNSEDSTKTAITNVDYKYYYDNLKVTEDQGDKLKNQEVLEKLIELYNYVNNIKIATTTVPEDYIDMEIKLDDTDNSTYETIKTYDDLTELNSTFRNYIYNSLTEEKPYSTLRSVGTFRYLAFKLDKDHFEVDFVNAEKDEDGNEVWSKDDNFAEFKEILDGDDEDAKEKLLNQLRSVDGVVNSNDDVDYDALKTYMENEIGEWTEIVTEEKLTSFYINSTVRELLKDAKVEIYDKVVRTFYNHNNTNLAKGKNKSGDILLVLKTKMNGEDVKIEITVNEFYERIEANNGVETAIDVAINKLLVNEFNKKDGLFKDEDISMKKLKNDYKRTIKDFSENKFAGEGYPADIGRETFLILLFGTSDINEAIELGLLVPQLREAYANNLDLYTPDNVDVFSVLQDYTERQYQNYLGVSAKHLLVYLDTDGSGTPTNPHEYFETLSDDQVLEIQEAVVELYELILFEIGQKVGHSSGDGIVSTENYSEIFADVIEKDYNDTARINLGNFKAEKYEKYRKLGLNIKFEDLGSNITNSSNFPFNDSTLDKVFYDRTMAIYEHIVAQRDASDEDLVNDGLPYFDFAGDFNVIQDLNPIHDLIANDVIEEITSDFGFHFILIDKVVEKESAEFDAKDDEKHQKYVFELGEGDDKVKYNIYNDSEIISKSQIEYYVRGENKGIDIPPKVKQALNAYFLPVYEMFNSNYMKQELFFSYLFGHGVNTPELMTRINTIREINQNMFHKYMEDNARYDALYEDWFESFGLGIE